MRLALLSLVLVFSAGCDSGPVDSDLDVGGFSGFDASANAAIAGWAFNTVTRSGAAGREMAELRFETTTRPDYQGEQTIVVSIPRASATQEGAYALTGGAAGAPSATVTRWETGDRTTSASKVETASHGTVTITDVRTSRDYTALSGTVEIAFPSGLLTGTFRAVDDSAPTPVSRCDARGCVDY